MAVDSGTYDDATKLRRLKIAEAMLGDPKKPVQHWAEGLSEIGKGLLGGYQLSKADEDQRAQNAESNASIYAMAGLPAPAQAASAPTGGFQKLAALMSGASDAAPVAPASPAAAPPMASPDAVSPIPPQAPIAPSGPGKIYSNDEPSPLDPPSGIDRKAMIATILGEAGNQGATGMNAVGSVIRNRAVNGGFGGDTPTGVVTAKNQFEPWNTEAGRSKMSAAASNPQQAAAADQAIAMAYGEGGTAPADPTNGAMNFISPKVQAALGRSTPKWAQGPGQDIGDHRFFGGKPQDPSQQPYDVAGPAVSAPGGSPAVAQAMAAPTLPQGTASGVFAGVPRDKLPALVQGLTSKNPTMKALAVQQLGNYTKADGPTDEIKEYNLDAAQRKANGQSPRSFFEFKTELKKAGATNVTTNVGKDEEAFDKEAGKIVANRYNDLAAEGPAAKQMVSDVQTLQQLGTQIGTGKGAQVKEAIGPYAQALGIDIKGLSDIQAYEAIVNRVAPTLRVKGSGAQSDMELKNFLKSLPSLGNTPEGNSLVAKTMQGLAQNKVQASEIASSALNKEITRKEADKRLLALPDPMQEWRDSQKAAKPTDTQSSGDGWKDMGGGIRIREKK